MRRYLQNFYNLLNTFYRERAYASREKQRRPGQCTNRFADAVFRPQIDLDPGVLVGPERY